MCHLKKPLVITEAAVRGSTITPGPGYLCDHHFRDAVKLAQQPFCSKTYITYVLVPEILLRGLEVDIVTGLPVDL